MATHGTSGVTRGLCKKRINDPLQVVDEALEGFVGAHSGLVTLAAPRVVARPTRASAKVGFVVGGVPATSRRSPGMSAGGSQTRPPVETSFAPPPPEVILDAIRVASTGRGVIMGYGNDVGDVLNFGLAAEFVGEGSRGSADPGATSFAIIVEALVGRVERVPAPAPTPQRVDR